MYSLGQATQQGVTCLPLRQRLEQYAMDGAVVAARIFSWQCDTAKVSGRASKHVCVECAVASERVSE